MRVETAQERIVRRSIPVTESGCWLWLGSHKADGYAKYDATNTAHRVSHISFKGPIPEGMEIDHTCNVPCCVNPDHLETVTQIENARRKMIRRTHCGNGHAYAVNRVSYNGKYFCRACCNMHSKLSKDRRRKLAV